MLKRCEFWWNAKKNDFNERKINFILITRKWSKIKTDLFRRRKRLIGIWNDQKNKINRRVKKQNSNIRLTKIRITFNKIEFRIKFIDSRFWFLELKKWPRSIIETIRFVRIRLLTSQTESIEIIQW